MTRLFPLLLAGCIPLSFSGSSVPTDHVVKLSRADIEAASSTACVLPWVTSSARANKKAALAELEARGIRIVEKLVLRSSTAMPRRLYVGKDFWKKDLETQTEVLTHEVFHYCQRDMMGPSFDEDWAESPGRWKIEMPAFAQQVRTAVLHGASDEAVQDWIDKRIVSIRNSYLLWNLEPVQYETETRKVLEAAAH